MKQIALIARLEGRVSHGSVRGDSVLGRAALRAFGAHFLAIIMWFGQPAAAAPAADDSLPALTNVLQVLQLGTGGARQRPHPVDFEAVTTLPVAAQPTWIWVQEDTNAVIVVHTNRFDRQPGQRVRVRGVVGSGVHAVKDRKSTRLNSSHIQKSRMPSSA